MGLVRPDLSLGGLILGLRSLIWSLRGLIWGLRDLIWGLRGGDIETRLEKLPCLESSVIHPSGAAAQK